MKSPLYILVLFFLAILLIPTVFLSVFWKLFIQFLTNEDKSLGKLILEINQKYRKFSLLNISEEKYTFAYHISTICAIVICPINGYFLGFKADQSKFYFQIEDFKLNFEDKKRKLLNISIVQTICWLLNVILCILCMILSSKIIILIIIFNCLSRSTIVGGCQSLLLTW